MIYISPPFGAWIQPQTALPILGSYTLLPRPGRMRQIIKTVRKFPGGWVNAIELRNPGIEGLEYQPGIVYSLAGIADGDWERLHDVLLGKNWPAYLIELNLSCPNIAEYGHFKISTLRAFNRLRNSTIIIKLPPFRKEIEATIGIALESNIKRFHLSNTIPSFRGGISGDLLRTINLPLVEHFARAYPQARIIAGGGIYNQNNAYEYLNAGATDLSLATVFLHPVRGFKVYNSARKIWKIR